MAMNDRSLARTGDAYLDGRVAESLVLRGDISAMNPEDKAAYYVAACNALGLNAASQPFAMLRLNGKEVMYPTRTATDQLAAIHKLSREIIDGPRVDDRFGEKVGFCACRVTHPNGRTEVSIATLPLAGDKSMLPMKLETKAKRRATLSILGLGMLDETEIESIPASEKSASVGVDMGRVRALVSQGFTDVRSYDEQVTEAVTPLDMLRDDLASASTPEGIRESYRAHARDIAEMDEDGDALRLARNACHEAVTKHGFGATKADTDRILGKGERPVVAQPAPAEREVEVVVAAEHPAVTALREALDVAKSLDAVVSVWRQAGGEVRGLDEGEKFNAWTLAVEAVARINATTCEAADVALRGALAGPKGDGPKPGRKPATKPAADAQGSSAEAAPSAGPQARAPHPESAPYVAADGAEAWAARVARYTNTIELRRSWERHVPAYRAAGVLEARRAVSVARLQALASIDDEGIAQRVLDDAERAADAAARRPHVTSAGEVRRRQREAQERAGMREVAQAYAKAS